jgi:lipoprotein LpqB-like beta-propeller protein
VWTVADGNVVRLVRNSQGNWGANPVNAAGVLQYGPITDLRLSRDGVRVAAVAGGKVVVGSVVRTATDSVAIQEVRPLQQNKLTDVVGIDWLEQDTLVVVTDQPDLPVANVEVDGLQCDPYNSSNLEAPITAVTAMPSRAVVVTDANGMSAVSYVGQVWQRLSAVEGPGSMPFYPG